MTAVKIQSLSKYYKLYRNSGDRIKDIFLSKLFKKNWHVKHWALSNINLELCEGESVGIIGRNGSGKSTLLLIISNVLRAYEGSVTVNGRVTGLLELGAGMNPDFTGRENIYTYGSILGLTRYEIDDLFQEIEYFADIGEYIDQPVRTYSSGMFVRLAFSVASRVNPDIFIIDEALGVGDVFFQQRCYTYMKSKMMNKTKIIVSHDMAVISNFAERVIVMDCGQVVFDGPTLKGIEYFSSLIRSTRKNMEHRPDITDESEKFSTDAVPSQWCELDFIPFQEQQLAGNGKVKLICANIEVFSKQNNSLVTAGCQVSIKVKLVVNEFVEYPIIGYYLNDRVGQQIFGAVADRQRLTSLRNGMYLVTLVFKWPEIANGDYFLNVGIGDGQDEFDHEILCWVQNFHQFTSIQDKSIHGIFNTPIQKFELDLITPHQTQGISLNG